MENIVESLCKQGTISFEFLERGYSVIFEPHFKNTLPEQLQSTIIIVRNNLLETVEALDHYITVEKHWTEFPDAFWIDQAIETLLQQLKTASLRQVDNCILSPDTNTAF